MVKASDVAIILISVIIIGFLAAWYPIRYLTLRYVEELKEDT
jgi:ABC-type antimicrobial peptide transport system permease subunit